MRSTKKPFLLLGVTLLLTAVWTVVAVACDLQDFEDEYKHYDKF